MVISTTVSTSTRSINVLMESGITERLALVQALDGDVHWRHDEFGMRAGGAPEWLGHRGRLSVAEVLAQVPDCERQVLAWTREELEAGHQDPDLDIFQRDVRRRALERLREQVDALSATP